MPYNDAFDEITRLIDLNLDEYKYIMNRFTSDDFIRQKYYSLHVNLVWYFDLTQVEHFGDGKNKDTGNYTMFILDCASRKVVYWNIFNKSTTMNSELLIQNMLNAIEKINDGNYPIMIHQDSDIKNNSYQAIEVLHTEGVMASFN